MKKVPKGKLITINEIRKVIQKGKKYLVLDYEKSLAKL